jgi:glycine cleavage system H protein
MKEVNELNLPDTLRYSDDHEWAEQCGDTVKIGITDYAQDQLGDIVFVEMPETGDSFAKGEEFGTLESVKAVSEMFIPISGEITAVNEELEDSPELVNEDPYANWIIEVKPSDAAELESLLTKDTYLQLIKS